MKLSTFLHRLGFGLVLLTVFALPIFFLPITSDFYDFNKQALLCIVSLILVVLWGVTSVLDKQVRVKRSAFLVPLLVLCAVWLLATVVKTPNRFDAFFEPGQTGTLLALTALFMAITNFVHTRRESALVLVSHLSSLSVLSILSILWATTKYSFIGNPLTALLVLLITLPIPVILASRETEMGPKSAGLAASILLSVVGIGMLAYKLFFAPAAIKPNFLPLQSGWAIALEAMKASPLVGTGPTSFLSDFTAFRPLAFNLSRNWSLRFVSSSNYYLEILATTGLVGLAAYLWLASKIVSETLKSWRTSRHPLQSALLSAATLALVIQLLVPTGLMFMATLVIFLALAAINNEEGALIESSQVLGGIILTLAVIVTGMAGYFIVRGYMGEIYFQKALLAANSNNGKDTYDYLLKAMTANPTRDVYRVSFSQANFLLANSLASKKDLTDTERQNVAQLIQQAVDSAKNAVALSPAKVTNLENLASIYQNLVNFAQGADAWTVASYRQAINLDPINPALRIALGGVFYGQKNYDEAASLFQQAVNLKPDYANAHYNLAAAYREKGDFPRAFAAMQATVRLLDTTSSDFTKANEELEQLRAKIPVPTPSANQGTPTQLTKPEPLPTPKVNPPLKLDQSLSPEIIPSPTPSQ